jgi:hypothetical protein
VTHVGPGAAYQLNMIAVLPSSTPLAGPLTGFRTSTASEVDRRWRRAAPDSARDRVADLWAGTEQAGTAAGLFVAVRRDGSRLLLVGAEDGAQVRTGEGEPAR